ncbi:MAG: nucleotidyltransferase domain-containing protein [bacterium]|nr:nucleotidyltransferase domain-containing protein [bacterium]
MYNCKQNETKAGAALDPSILDDIIRRVVEVARPEKIILFGSAARGEMNRHSDVDLLVVKDGVDALDLMGQIYRNLRGVGAAVDAIVVSPQDVERYKDSHALVIKPALREGRVVYETA